MRYFTTGAFGPAARGRTNGRVLDADGFEIAVCRDVEAAIDPSFDFDSANTRRIPYILSTNAVARDRHTVKSDGFELKAYKSNPVFLWAHDTSQPPVGKMVDLIMSRTALRGVVEYADADLSPFADMVYRMVKKRFLNAVSISWLPLEWRFSADRNRVGGIDFLRQDLLEVSQVPVPAMASALATARAGGIDTSPVIAWAERILDSGLPARPRSAVEQARRAALGLPDPSQDRGRERRRRAAEAIGIKIAGEDRAARQRAAEAIRITGSCP